MKFMLLLLFLLAVNEVHMKNLDYMSYQIPGITSEMLSADWWISRTKDPDRVIADSIKLETYRKTLLSECPVCFDLWNDSEEIRSEILKSEIQKLSSVPAKERYMNNQLLTEEYFNSLLQNLNLAQIEQTVRIRYGICVRRTEMRTFPVSDRVFSEKDDYEFDRFMETAVYPLEPMRILHESTDGKWYFARIYNYQAWIPAADVAAGEKEDIYSLSEPKNFLVVTGKKAFTGFNPDFPELSELQLDMGVKIPLCSTSEIFESLNGQSTYCNYVVKMPFRNSAGMLEIKNCLIPYSEEVRRGYLPLTRRNIIAQAFRFLGQRYGWGGMFNTRDCSAFIMDIYRSMGLWLPRNASEQGKLAPGTAHELTEEMNPEEKKKIFDNLPAGSPVYMSGHAMMYLGKVSDDYFIIHDFSSVTLKDEKSELKSMRVRSVAITPLLNTFLSSGKPYIDGLYTAREFPGN